MSNTQGTPVATGAFVRIWLDALTKPREDTYASIAASPDAKALTGYIWVFLSSLVASLVAVLAQGTLIRQQLENSGFSLDQLGAGAGTVAVGLLCFAPLGTVLGTLLYAIWVAIVQWLAKMFGGRGTNDQLAFTLAAIAAPYSLLSAVFVLLGAIPYVGFCFNLVLSLAGLYVLFLQIMAVKAVNRFGWGPAVGSYIIPGLAIFLVCCVVFFIVASVAGVALGSALSSMNQNVIP